jgi:hypothetical protein|tara:strand:- start:1637 stop:1816 length:180 start_codon:yes stop_codon:yes gene_type:complete
MRNADKKLTSVRIDPEMYEDFQMECLRDKFSFQKLASRAIFLYLNDKEFKSKIQKQLIK